jgi:tetratricopeptide (TPR) repeat protein
MKKVLFAASILLIFSFCLNYQCWAADEESLGREAEQAGKYRESLTHYVSALQSASEGSSKDQQLREKIISLALKVTPPPAVPDEARRYAVRGKSAISEAKSASDFEEAAREFSKALRIAPWWAESYFNRAVAQEKAGQLNDAISSLKLYLLAAPNDPDTDKVKDQIYALEYKKEKAQKEISAKRQAEEQERQRLAEQKASAERLNGRWVTGREIMSFERGCAQNFLYEGDLYSITVKDNQIDIYGLQYSSANCSGSFRYPRYPFKLLVFRGTIQDNQVAGTMYEYKAYNQEKRLLDYVTSDLYVAKTYAFRAEIKWDSSGRSFTMNKVFERDSEIGNVDRSQKWERE